MSAEAFSRVETTASRLKAAAQQIGDPALNLASSMLGNAVGAAGASLNPGTVNDIVFAVNDVMGALESLSAADAAQVDSLVEALKEEVDALRSATALPAALIEATRAFQDKLRQRRAAIERQTYREGAIVELPHPPEELHTDAATLKPLLAAAGFATPSLDSFCKNQASLRFHSIVEMIDELDTIIG